MKKKCLSFKQVIYCAAMLALVLLSGCKMRRIELTPLLTDVEQTEPVSEERKEKRDNIIISMVPKSLDNPVFLDTKEEAERICKELGVDFEWLAPYQMSSIDQENIVKSLIKRKVDGILISCIDPERMAPLIDQAVAAGIKVATFDSDSPKSKRLFYCGTDNYNAGKASSKALADILETENRIENELNVLVMTGGTGALNLNERLQGFKETNEKLNLKVNYIDTLVCNDDINTASEMLEQYIRNKALKGVRVDVFFSTGGWPLFVSPDSMPSFQEWCNEGGVSISIDTFYPMLIAAQKGMADALIGQDFKEMGRLSVLNLYEAIDKGTVESNFIDTGLEFADKESYDLLLATKKPWEIK